MDTKHHVEPLPLFRTEAVRFRAARLDGEVIVAIRSPWLMLGVAATVLVALVATTAFATNVNRKQAVTGVIAQPGENAGNTSLEAAIVIPANAVGRIRRGQPVSLHFDAFPSRSYGEWRGKVESVSLVPAPNNLPMAMTIYSGVVTIERPYVDVDGARIRLQPGMTFNADIVLGQYSLLQWMFDPERK